MMAYKSIIIGLGQIGIGYDLDLDLEGVIHTHSRALSRHPNFELLCAVDLAEDRRNLFIENYSKPAFASIESALEENSPDVVIVSCPTRLHYESIKTVLKYANPKAILCEKPLAYDLAEAREMVDECEKADVKLFVNYMRRADPGAMEVKSRIESGKIEQPIKGVAWYSKGLLHNGSHIFNLLEFWLGPYVEARVLNTGRLSNNEDAEPDVLVTFALGKVILMAAWEESFSHHTIELLSPSGRLRYEQSGKLIVWEAAVSCAINAEIKSLQSSPEIIFNGMARYQWNVAEELSKALLNEPTTLSTGKQSLKTIEAIHQIMNQ